MAIATTITGQIFCQQSTNQTVAGAGAIFAPKGNPSSGCQAKVFYTRLGEFNKGPVGIKHRKGPRNPVPRAPNSNETDVHSTGTSKQVVICSRNSGSPKERSNPKRCVLFSELLQPNVPSSEERGLISARSRLKSFKRVYLQRTLPNGRPTSVKISSTKRGLYDKNRSQGCVLNCPNPSKLSEVPQFYHGKSSLPVLFPTVRAKYSSKNFHKTNETSYSIPKMPRHANDRVSRRYTVSGPNQGGIQVSNIPNNKSVGVSRLHSKLRKVSADTRPTSGIPGFIIDAENMTISLPRNKQKKIRDLCKKAGQNTEITVRSIAQILGVLEATRPALRAAPLHFRQLQQLQVSALRQSKSYTNLITLTENAKRDLDWWVQNIYTVPEGPINPPEPTTIIYTDASKAGWGATNNKWSTGGSWSAEEAKLHINVLELRAAILGLKTFLKDQHSIVVRLYLDNTTAVAYINHLGGTRSQALLKEALKLWEWCSRHEIFPMAQHLPGKENILADSESRRSEDTSDWQLNPLIVRPFLKDRQVDLFASRLTTQLPVYASWRPDPMAKYTDAFTMNWGEIKGYAFPPFNLVSRVLQKVLQDQAEIVLVTPVWKTQPWWPILLEMSIQQPVLLGNDKTLLINPRDPSRSHPLFPRLHLAVWLISSNVTKQRDFQKTLPIFLQHPLSQAPKNAINQHGTLGEAGAFRDRLIHFVHP